MVTDSTKEMDGLDEGVGYWRHRFFEEMDGWSETTEGARSWAELPAGAIKYVRRIEELIECPVALLSTSPDREDTILVRDPFED